MKLTTSITKALAVMLMLLINVGILTAQQSPVYYLSPVYKTPGVATSGIDHWDTLSCTTYTVVNSSQATWGTAGSDTWYVVNGNTSCCNVTCAGNVHLILMNGCTLNTNGITVNSGSATLTIYAQDTTSSVDGVLNAIPTSPEYDGYAGIGSEYYSDNGAITINGGNVTARGGANSAGIGGGGPGSGLNITINGGKVTAFGGIDGAGIGGGAQSSGSNITINGGNVTALGGANGAGIGGGGLGGVGSNIIINGGIVSATGNALSAGIGGGYNGNCSNITISGGIVTATGGVYAAGIGAGYEGSASNIFVADNVILKAGASANPTDVIAHASITTDVALSLAGKRYATAVDHIAVQDTFIVAGDWDSPSNWNNGIVPIPNQNIVIAANCTIPDNYNAECAKVIIKSNAVLNVKPRATLTADSIVNQVAGNLVICSDSTGTGSVLYTGGTNPKATVEMYFKGTTHPDGVAQNPDLQFRGFIGSPDAGQTLSNITMYRWDETHNADTATGCWVEPGDFEPKVGYGMANLTSSPIKRSYATTLCPVGDITYNLTRTDTEATFSAVNLITNSISAPIDMNLITLSQGVLEESTFYFFNTRTYSEWEDDQETAITAYPTKSGYVVAQSSMIPAGQSFAVIAQSDNVTLTIPASAISDSASRPMYAPRQESEFGILTLTVRSDDGMDELFLLESDACDGQFNNGYDGTKIFASKAPQIYATNSFGMMAVNADNTLLGQYIGVRQGAKSNTITMTINRRNLDNYTSLSLYDCMDGTYYDLTDDETTITFTVTGDQPRRFLISGVRDDGSKFIATESGSLVIVGDQLILVNFGRTEAQIVLTDVTGRTLWTENSRNGSTFTLPQLPAGVYFVSCGKATTKYLTR